MIQLPKTLFTYLVGVIAGGALASTIWVVCAGRILGLLIGVVVVVALCAGAACWAWGEEP